jgi:hypothetical protein
VGVSKTLNTICCFTFCSVDVGFLTEQRGVV